MQKYHPKTRIASAADRLFRLMSACALGLSWFIYLWGLQFTSLTAGIALGGLLWLCARQFGKMSTEKREKQMRRTIGGELALERLLLLSPRHAGFQAALWLAPRYAITMQKAVDWGVVGMMNGKRTSIRLIAQHESTTVGIQQIVDIVREIRMTEIQQSFLCSTAPISQEAIRYAAQAPTPIRLIHRSELIELAGACCPATDEQLSALAKRKKEQRSRKEWLQTICEPSRARRYLGYGIGLGLLALLTRQGFYPFPAAVCLLLFVGCKWSAARSRAGVGQGDPFQHR